MSIKLKKQSASSVAIPSDSHVQLYVGSDGMPRIKDSEGSITELAQSGVVTLAQQANPPSSEADKFKIYSQDVNGVAELFFMDDTGQEIQATNDGMLNAGGGGGGLTQNLVLRHSSFTADVNTAYCVWTADGMTKTVTLPANPSEGDMVEISALGGGSDNITINGNGNYVTWGGTRLGSPVTFYSAGFHALLRWTDENGGQWCNIADNVTARFGGDGVPSVNTILFSDGAGRVTGRIVQPNSVVGRVGNEDIAYLLNHTRVFDNSPEITDTALQPVFGFEWNPPELGVHYCFEFHLLITQAAATGIVGFAIQYGDTAQSLSSDVTFSATIARANNLVTYGTVNTGTGSVDDAAARAIGGPFETMIVGSFKPDLAGVKTLRLMCKRSAGTTHILRGSWARVWRAETF